MILLASALLLALAVALTLRNARVARETRAHVEASVLAEIAEAGLIASGDPLGTFDVRGQIDGVDIEITNGAPRKRPDLTPETTPACVVWVAVPLADQLVCKIAAIDEAMGPLPVVPRTETGHWLFDDLYAVFVDPGGVPSSTSYRGLPDRTETRWTQAPILDEVSDLGLLWLRVREGYAEFAFPPLDTRDVVRAAKVAVAFAHAVGGKVAPVLSAPPPRRAAIVVPDTVAAMKTVWQWAAFIGLPCGFGLSTAAPLRAVDEWFFCGQGDRFIEVAFDEGRSLQCEGHPENSLALHYLGSALLVGSIIPLVWLWIIRPRAVVKPI